MDYVDPFRYPECGKLLPLKFSVYRKDAIHKMHSWVDGINEGHTPQSDPF